MKIAITTAIVGGIGGLERNVFTLVEAMNHHDIDIYAMKFIQKGFVPKGNNVTIRCFFETETGLSIEIDQDKDYDLYIYYASMLPIYIGDYLKVKKKAVIPCGNDVSMFEEHFDYVFCQAEDNTRFFKDMAKKVVLTPCVIIPVDRTEPVEGVPPNFFLTVFNPYDLLRQYSDGVKPVKGHDLVYALADRFSIPLVWCHSDVSLPTAQNIVEHPKIIHCPNLKQEQMYSLYETATAYVSFSREEGFGWSVADAVMYNRPIISREIGFLSTFPKKRGIYLYKDETQLETLIGLSKFDCETYNNTCFDPRAFESTLSCLIS